LLRGMRARNADGQLDTDTVGKKADWRGVLEGDSERELRKGILNDSKMDRV